MTEARAQPLRGCLVRLVIIAAIVLLPVKCVSDFVAEERAAERCKDWSETVYVAAQLGDQSRTPEAIVSLVHARQGAVDRRPDGCADNWKVEASVTSLCDEWQSGMWDATRDLPTVVPAEELGAARAQRATLLAPWISVDPGGCTSNWKARAATADPVAAPPPVTPSGGGDTGPGTDVDVPDVDSPVNAGCGWSWRGGFGCGVGVG